MKKILLIPSLFFYFIKLLGQDTTKHTEFKPSLKIWTQFFGDYAYKIEADTNKRGSVQYSGYNKNSNLFDVRRIYFGWNYELHPKVSAEGLLAHEGQSEPGGNRTVYIKNASIKWKDVFKNSDLIFGLSNTPAWNNSEEVWGFRSVEKTIADMRKISSRTDFGVTLQGKYKDGMLGYTLMLGNGSGAKPELDEFKKFYGDVYAKLWNKKIWVDLYFDYERTQLTSYHKSKTGYKGLVAYQGEAISVGCEVFEQIQENNVIFGEPSPSTDSATGNVIMLGISFFARGQIIKNKVSAFVRYDRYNPDINFNKNNLYDKTYPYSLENFITTGIDFTPIKNIHIIPNVWYNSYFNRSKQANPSLFTIDGDDLVLRLTLSYLFRP